MINNTFTVSDETPNSYGFVVLTEGINTVMFERNPVMFYMHDREQGIVGRWENLRKEGTQLLADAVFDDTTELGKQVKTQVEKGFLRCASIGIENVVKERLNGVETVVKCDLKEISIVDIPANENAVKLYKKNGGVCYTLADLEPATTGNLRADIIALLELAEDCTDEDILSAINALKPSDNVDSEIDNAVMSGYIETSQRANFKAMALANRAAFTSFIATKRQEQTPQIVQLVSDAAHKGKLLYNERGIYETIGTKLGINTLRTLLNTLKGATRPSDVIRAGSSRANWTLADYRRFAPDELKSNPSLYAQLVAKEGGTCQEPQTLDYMRRNNPEYLKAHPDVYERLLTEQQTKH